jgi:hypothetical protein
MQVLVGARIFDGERFLDDHALVIDGARIAGLTPYAERPRSNRQCCPCTVLSNRREEVSRDLIPK